MRAFIKLLINRRWEEIPADELRYAAISDKLCFFHLEDGSTLSLFITLSELETRLPETGFVRISRNCIVNYHAVQAIKGGHVLLRSGESLPYSKRRERELLEGWKEHNRSQKAKDSRYPYIARRFLPLLGTLTEEQLSKLEQVLRGDAKTFSLKNPT